MIGDVEIGENIEWLSVKPHIGDPENIEVLLKDGTTYTFTPVIKTVENSLKLVFEVRRKKETP
tara:strand:+ start:426 stop:614 length:189 start_codon:yes stop_codon:yes gene_type:complete